MVVYALFRYYTRPECRQCYYMTECATCPIITDLAHLRYDTFGKFLFAYFYRLTAVFHNNMLQTQQVFLFFSSRHFLARAPAPTSAAGLQTRPGLRAQEHRRRADKDTREGLGTGI